MNKNHTNNLPHVLSLLSLIMLDFVLIIGIFLHSKANFVEVFKHIK